MQAPSAPTFNAAQATNAQTNSNISTAAANSYLNAINQYTPWGNLIYQQTGTRQMGDGSVSIPEWQVYTELSPSQQAIFDKTQGLQSSALDTAKTALTNVQNTISQPYDPTAFRDKAYGDLMARSTQDINKQVDATKAQLANQGISAGSDAYNNALMPWTRALVDASQQSNLNAGNLAQQNLTFRNVPLQDYATMLGLSSNVTAPQFQNTQQQPIANTDVTGAYLAQSQSQMANAQMQMMGGLFGLGGSGLMAGAMFL